MTPFTIEHRFVGASRAEVERLYLFDDEFNTATFRALGFERRVVSREQHGNVLERVLWLCPLRGLPKPFAGLVSSDAFHIEERLRFDLAAHRGTFSNQPSVLGQQFRAEGVVTYEEHQGSVVVRLDGAAHAKLPLLSARAEKLSVRSAEEQLAGLAEAVRARLAAPAAQAPLPL